MSKKNILIFHPIGKWIGGGETGLLDLIKNIDQSKFNLQVVLPHKGPLSEELTKMNISYKFAHIRRWHAVETKILLPYLITKLCLIIRSFQPALIFCNSHDVVPFGIITKAIFKKPVVSFVGVELSHDIAKKYMIHHSNAVIVKTDWQKNEIKKIKEEGIYNFGDGFELNKFDTKNKELARSELLRELKLDSDAIILLSVGRFEDVKNFEYTIKALYELHSKNIYLIIIGAKFDNSLYEQKIIKLVNELNLEDKVKILPFTKNLKKYFLGSDIFIHTSKSEGLPRSVIEAMLYGLPLILSDIEPHKEIMVKAKGFLSSLQSSYSMAEKINYFYNNKHLIKEFGDFNRKIANENYDIKVYTKKIEQIFLSLT